MTPIKSITKITMRYLTRLHAVMLFMAIPWILYMILDIMYGSFMNNHGIEKSLIVLLAYMIIWKWMTHYLKKKSLSDILDYNKLRDEENHEFAKLVLEGKLYTDNRILDIVREMGKIMIEEERKND